MYNYADAIRYVALDYTDPRDAEAARRKAYARAQGILDTL